MCATAPAPLVVAGTTAATTAATAAARACVAHAFALIPLRVCEWLRGRVSLCVRDKGDTVLHITALQMAVVSGCDSESE